MGIKWITPGWMNRDSNEAMKCVEKLTNQKKLLNAALESPHPSVRHKAACKLTAGEELVDKLDAFMRRELKTLNCKYISDNSLRSNHRAVIVQYFILKKSSDRKAFDLLVYWLNEFAYEWMLEILYTLSQDEIFVLAQMRSSAKTALALVERLSVEQQIKLAHTGACDCALAAFDKVKDSIDHATLYTLASDAKHLWIRDKALEALAVNYPIEAKQIAADARAREEAIIEAKKSAYIDEAKATPINYLSLVISAIDEHFKDPKNCKELEQLCVDRYFAMIESKEYFKSEYEVSKALEAHLKTQDVICDYLMRADYGSSELDEDRAQTMVRKVKSSADLDRLAHSAKSGYVRWKACKRNGGHIFDTTADQKVRCACTICGYVEHVGCPNDGERWTCTRCGADITPRSFSEGLPHSTIRFSDGTTDVINGYDGQQYHDDSI